MNLVYLENLVVSPVPRRAADRGPGLGGDEAAEEEGEGEGAGFGGPSRLHVRLRQPGQLVDCLINRLIY